MRDARTMFEMTCHSRYMAEYIQCSTGYNLKSLVQTGKTDGPSEPHFLHHLEICKRGGICMVIRQGSFVYSLMLPGPNISSFLWDESASGLIILDACGCNDGSRSRDDLDIMNVVVIVEVVVAATAFAGNRFRRRLTRQRL